MNFMKRFIAKIKNDLKNNKRKIIGTILLFIGVYGIYNVFFIGEHIIFVLGFYICILGVIILITSSQKNKKIYQNYKEEKSLFSSDQPIKKIKDDKLHRGIFSKHLSKMILSNRSKETFVIGLYGKWGTGKTSIINMFIESIEEESKNLNDNEKPIIINFSPWNFSGTDNLIPIFFKQLKLEVLHQNENLKSLSNLLGLFSEAHVLLNLIPTYGNLTANVTGGIVKTLANFINNKNNFQDYEKTKRDLIEELCKQQQKIIVIIDNIDRLGNSQIRVIFKLVAEIANFPYMTYLLSMDMDIVSRALEDIQNCDGKEYLEKIIQIPFELPSIRKEDLKILAVSELYDILVPYPEEIVDEEKYMHLYDRCIDPFVTTIRDMKRIINTFRLKYTYLHGEVDVSDLLVLTTIEVKRPLLYRWIYENKSSLCIIFALPYTKDDKDKNKRFITDNLIRNGIDGDEAFPILSILFPLVRNYADNKNYYNEQKGSKRGNKNLSNPERFDLYFQLNLQQIPVLDIDIRKSLIDMVPDQIDEFLQNLNQERKISFYLDQIYNYKGFISADRINVIIEAFIRNHRFISDVPYSLQLLIPPSDLLIYCACYMLEKIEDDKICFDIVKDLITKHPYAEFPAISNFFHAIEHRSGRIPNDSANRICDIFNDEQFSELENIYTKRINEFVKENIIFEMCNLSHLIILWESFSSKNECNNYFIKELKNPCTLLKFICKTSHIWRGSDSQYGWIINYRRIRKYIGNDFDIKKLINDYDKQFLIQNFTDQELEIIATCQINEIEDDDIKYDKPSSEKAKIIIEKWKQEVEKRKNLMTIVL